MTFMTRDLIHENPSQRLLDDTPLHDARILTEGGVTARINLDGKLYILRITRAGKLILTK